MVALKRFFQTERTPAGSGDQDVHRGNSSDDGIHLQRSPGLKASRPLGTDHHFQGIETQFEEFHDQLNARPFSRRLQVPPSRASSRLTTSNPRHIDLLDALFSSHRYRTQSPSALPPITPYNEDIAERNMTRFLQVQPSKENVYSRFISALYQEDVADRNIAKSSRGGRPISRNSSTRSRATSAHTFRSSSQVRQDDVSARSRPPTSQSRMTAYSQPSQDNEPVASVNEKVSSSAGHSLRHQRSAPALLAEQPDTSQKSPPLCPGGFLGVPSAHKQGNTWSNTPLPDSPTLPGATWREKDIKKDRQPTPIKSVPPRLGSKKNIRDLSINTELAARGRPTRRIAHRAIQPPTPNTLTVSQNPSIEEVMSSPLPARTPMSISPKPPSEEKVAEIMDMFKQASSTTHVITPHPTFETLQDAIVREINSHEAFRRVPVPEAGPLFTPSLLQDSFDKCESSASSGPHRSLSPKESQLAKLIRRGSKRNRRDSELRKSISTSVPSKIFRQASGSTRQRRHTDAPLPTPGVFDAKRAGQNGGKERSKEQVIYMDLLLRSQKSFPGTGSKKTLHPVRSLSRAQSAGTLPSHEISHELHTAPSVCYMRAQTSGSSSNGQTDFSADDIDEEVIHLPSVGPPPVRIRGIDRNNVTYSTENMIPRSAHRLMSWPQPSCRNIILSGNTTRNENDPAQYSLRSGRQVRETRSVESY